MDLARSLSLSLDSPISLVDKLNINDSILSYERITSSKEKKRVEEMAIERTMEYMWNKRYWVLREQQSKGPADLYAYKIINDERIEYFIDAKGIHPNAKQTPRFKPRADLKFINRDRVIRRIVSIVHNGKIKFVEGFHSNYKNLEEKYIKII